MIYLLESRRNNGVFYLVAQSSFFFRFIFLFAATTETIVAPICECNDLGDRSVFGYFPTDFFLEFFSDAFERITR